VTIARALAVVVVVAVATLLAVGCGGIDAGPKPSNPVLARGQSVYVDHCATCHGGKGGGGSGPKLAGKVEADFPNIGDQIKVIADGKSGGMPAWKATLSAADITAVARYERECLGRTC
jgi:mono/diheme cytochrome c family protein